jgi:hypothetical protein
MKALISVALMLLAPGLAAAQSATKQAGTPGIAVIESSWRRVVRRNPLADDPLGTLEQQNRAERARDKVMRENGERAAVGLPQAPVPSRTVDPVRLVSRVSAPEYIYEVKISNIGAKKIRELVWGYVLLDPGTGREISDRRFTTKVSIRPGQSKKLVGRSSLPPLVVSAAKTNEALSDQYAERIEIHLVKYDDGSVWESASK